MANLIGSEPAAVFEDREVPGQWRVERFDQDGGCEVEVFISPNARHQAIDYAKRRYGTSVEKRLEPYSLAILRHFREMTSE
jgi:hypothetical protein